MIGITKITEEIEKIENDPILKKDLEHGIPSNYFFELPKTIWKIRSMGAKYVALQFPEGLLMYSCLISDILEKHTGCETVIMADVTYGACCVDDYTAKALGCDLLVHYGHSCLVPIQNTEGITMLYVFVNIQINLSHFVDCINENFKKEEKLAVVSTVQFIPSLQRLKKCLDFNIDKEGAPKIVIPQCKPLSPGEILGCTSPRLDTKDVDAILYLGDGRFHLESIMMHNPSIPAYQYDPYARKLTREFYDHDQMRKNRQKDIDVAKKSQVIGIIQGTLGRQGNMKIVEDMETRVAAKGKQFIRILLSEIFPEKVALFKDVDCFVQVACPRLSIDWGMQYERSILYPFELSVALDQITIPKDYWPMDYYSNESLGSWTNNHESHRPKRERRKARIVIGK